MDANANEKGPLCGPFSLIRRCSVDPGLEQPAFVRWTSELRAVGAHPVALLGEALSRAAEWSESPADRDKRRHRSEGQSDGA
jgi:hypothetical protein